MEQSRYQPFHRLYIFGFLCLLIGLIFIGISLYLLPVTFFDVSLDLPTVVFGFIHWCDEHYVLSQDAALKLLWGGFLTLGLLCILLADLSSNYIDKYILMAKTHHSLQEDLIDMKHILIILAIIILLILGGIKIFDVSFLASLPKK